MSNVIMCDACGRVFSQREVGWQHLTGVTIDGRSRTQEEVFDRCNRCVASTVATPVLPEATTPE